ncbi:MATE family efflux transporter [Texcoconibacillus texcoconensis]|uniref:Putative MATE family efflux protein n=1 Tax=Texcoconibacillus texcoconensis TaxID=1095777 RepID=A0A840QSJ9_9BACI|nr:MATE family efflux transporter [Texcoconibacillus texcoconensis]MBB5174345.1 putative MATE family efflux protein [Texcoconibacillus texcoconensis]
MKEETNNGKKKLTLFALTWPIFIEIFLHMLMGNADTLMLSQYSDDAVAAVGVSNQIMGFIVVMFGFIATGTTILISQFLGADRKQEANQIAVVSIATNLTFGLFLSIFLMGFGDTILRLMGLPEELMDTALLYLQIVGGFAFIQAMIMTVSAIIRSHGHTKDAMFVTMGMNVINVFGNFVLIFGALGFPELGPVGVAISTAASRFLGMLVMFIVLYKRITGGLPFNYLLKKFPKKELKQLLKIGIPSAGEQLSYNTSQVVVTSFIATMGTTALTTRVYAQNLMMFMLLFSAAIGQGTQILIGHLIGEQAMKEAYLRCIKSLSIGIAISTSMAIVIAFFREPLLGIFTDNSEVIGLGGTLLLLTVILEPGRAFNLIVINSLRAAGDVRFPVYIGVLSMWGVMVTLSYGLGVALGLGLIGVWISFILDEWLRGLLMLRRWRTRKWESMSFVDDQKNRETEEDNLVNKPATNQ